MWIAKMWGWVAPRLRVNHCVAIAAGFSTNCTHPNSCADYSSNVTPASS